MDAIEVIKAISCPKKVKDLWDNFQESTKAQDLFLKMETGVAYRMRLLGPFVRARRIFVPTIIKNNANKREIKSIINQDSKVIEEVSNRVSHLPSYDKKAIEKAKIFLKGKTDKHFLGNLCTLSNALIKNDSNVFRLKIVTLNWSTCQIIYQEHGANAKISGLKARDIVMKKESTQRNQRNQIQISNPPFGVFISDTSYSPIIGTTSGNPDAYGNSIVTMLQPVNAYEYDKNSFPVYTANLEEESTLTQSQIDYVMQNGLIDIIGVVKEINNSGYGNYIYAGVPQYRMPKDLNESIFYGMDKIEENRHIEKVEEDISDVPNSAFENFEKMRGTINSLEVE
jgi:hypothetical protein